MVIFYDFKYLKDSPMFYVIEYVFLQTQSKYPSKFYKIVAGDPVASSNKDKIFAIRLLYSNFQREY